MKYEELRSASNKQSNELITLKSNSAELKQKTKTEIVKIDQYSQRLNLEFYGKPEVRYEDVSQIMVNLCEKLVLTFKNIFRLLIECPNVSDAILILQQSS